MMPLFFARSLSPSKAVIALLGILGPFSAMATDGSPSAPARPNVLFIVADDLNDWIEPLRGHPQVQTPNLARLARRGTTFLNAHCQAPICNPSRVSVMTGLRPSTTGIYALLPGPRDVAETRDVLTLPQAFHRAGYATYSFGKINHDSAWKPEDLDAEFDQRVPLPAGMLPPEKISRLPGPDRGTDWGPFPASDEQVPDFKVADAAIAALRAAPTDRPFFIASGFRLPHVPLFVPSQWFDRYPPESLVLPPVKEDDREDTPLFSWYLHWRLPEPRLSVLRHYDEWAPHVRAYLACISFLDAQIGRLLDALEADPRGRDTVIVFWSDNGWHTGEKLITGKNTLWERSTRVPLLFAGPGIAAGARSSRPVELLDLYPTLAELCDLDTPSHLEGHSLLPLLADANAERPWPAITTDNQNNHSVRSEHWRYIRYADGSEELYNESNDPNEWTNLAGDPRYDAIKAEHRQWLPTRNLPPAPGSARRVLTYDPPTGQAVWEGKVIVPSELEH